MPDRIDGVPGTVEALFGPESTAGRTWADRHAKTLHRDGARGLLRRLTRIHYRTATKRKVLAGRLKGPGMHWSIRNVNPTAALVSLWANDEWETYWTQVA